MNVQLRIVMLIREFVSIWDYKMFTISEKIKFQFVPQTTKATIMVQYKLCLTSGLPEFSFVTDESSNRGCPMKICL